MRKFERLFIGSLCAVILCGVVLIAQSIATVGSGGEGRFTGTQFQLQPTATLAWVTTAGAADITLGRASANVFTASTVAFAALGTPANGSFAFCTDCAPTTAATCPGTKASCVCAGAGAGSLAVRVNATWYCPF